MLFPASSLVILLTSYVASQPIRVLILTSTYNVTVPQWARGEELVPGALLAADEINAKDHLLNGYDLKPVVILVPNCSVSEGIREMVSEILTSQSRIVGIVGLSCNKLTRAIVPLVNHTKLSLIQLSGAMALRPQGLVPNFYRILPKVDYHIKAVLELMQTLNWTKVSLLNSVAGFDNFYVKAAEVFVQQVQKNPRIKILLQAEVGDRGKHDTTVEHIIQIIQLSQVRITIAFLSPYQSFDLMCQAHLRGLTWPRNAWILFDISLQDVVSTVHCDVATLLEAMENAIIIQSNVQPDDLNRTLVSGKTYTNYLKSLSAYMHNTTFNPFANVLYDAVWGIGLSINSSLPTLHQMNIDLNRQQVELSNSILAATVGANFHGTNFTGASGQFYFSNLTTRQLERTLCITQVQNGSLASVGTSSMSEQVTNFNFTRLGSEIPTDIIPRTYSTLHRAAAIVLILHECLCTLFVTTVLLAFIVCRNHPEVKATSRYLSVCIFIGCYLFLFGAAMHTITSYMVIGQESSRRSICIIEISTTSVGLDVILATTLAKTLRIAYIFSHMGKVGVAWSDKVLLSLILLIIFGKICLLLLWYILDPYLLLDKVEYTGESGYYKVTQYCYSQEVRVWLSLIVAYSTVLCICLVVLAYKTRKIKRSNFKDTKKLNALITGVITTSVMGTALWGVLRLAGLFQASKVVGSLSYTVIPVLCQVLLFLPKLYTPFRKHIKTMRPSFALRSNSSNLGESTGSQIQYHRMRDLD